MIGFPHMAEDSRQAAEAPRPEPFTWRLPNAPVDAEDDWVLYDQFIDLAEAHRWKMSDVRREIEGVDPATLTEADHKIVDCIGEIAIVAGNAPTIVVNQLSVMLFDAEFAAWATYQVGEESKHFHVVRHYCRHVGHAMSAEHTEANVVRKQKDFDPDEYHDEHWVTLVNLLGETLNIHLYQQLSKAADEPVLKELLHRISLDERRHQQWFVAYFKKRAQAEDAYVGRALAALRVMLGIDEPPDRNAQRHQGTGSVNYLQATEKVLRHGFSVPIIARTVREQWQILESIFGDRLDIDKREFISRQTASASMVERQLG
ncbi:MAG: ferritin-like domain-containing protein [Candidatus Binatia bacterium]|nr:ferritin-like domain-containing protein [Candidatus Binatia bacterium]